MSNGNASINDRFNYLLDRLVKVSENMARDKLEYMKKLNDNIVELEDLK